MLIKGSSFSGNFMHEGRPGIKGGSQSSDPYIRSLSDKFDNVLAQSHPHSQANELRLLSNYAFSNTQDPETRKKLRAKIKEIGEQISLNYLDLAKERFSEISKSDNSVTTKLALITSVYENETWPNNINILNSQDLDIGVQFQIGDLYRETFNKLSMDELEDGRSIYGNISNDGYNIISSKTEFGKTALIDILSDSRSQPHKKAVDFYFSKGDEIVNQYARAGKVINTVESRQAVSKLLGRTIDEVTPEIIKEATQAVDSSCNDTLSKSMVLTRRVGEGHPVYEALTKGKDITDTVYTESNYASTSLDYASDFGRKNHVNIRINAPKGTRGLSFYGVKYMTTEFEFMLPRNITFKVIGYNRNLNEVIVNIMEQ